MARKAPRKFLIRRSKDNLSVVFGRRARRVGSHSLGNLQAVASSRAGRIDIKNIEETERRETDFFEIKNIRFNHWFTRNWTTDRVIIAQDLRVASHTSRADVIAEINNLTGYTTEQGTGDEGGSGLSSVGGTSVVSFRMESVDYCLEDGTGRILSEDDDIFVSEELNSVIQRSDGTFLSVDTRSVSHGGGGSAGNPVVSGTVTGTDLILTLDDASTVTIDATSLKNLDTSVSIASPNWYQTYASPGTGDATAGAQIDTLSPSASTNPYNFGQTLAKGYEFTFPVSFNEETNYFGVWNGTTSYTPSQAGLASYWHKHLRYSSSQDQIRHGSNAYDSVGWDLTDDYTTIHGTTQLALRYDYDTNKLQLWDITNAYTLICTATTAEDGNPVTISGAVNGTSSLPNFTVREQKYSIIAELTAGANTSWRGGVNTDTVIKLNEPLRPGHKIKCTLKAGWQNQYMTFDYTGSAIGQTGVENENTARVNANTTEKLTAGTGFTINTAATRYGTGDATVAMGGGNISWRYHIDNKIDLYDEDNEEILITKDANGDGNAIYLHLVVAATINAGYFNTDWERPEPFDAAWYYHPSSKYKPNQRFTPDTFDGSSRWIFGELMYPGQELVFTETQTGSGNTYIGMRNGDDTAWVRWVGFDGTKISATNEGFDITTNYSTGYTVTGKVLAMRYDHGDNKIKWYDINTTGVETLITTASVACDGNAIRISSSGNNRVPQSPVLRYYGWEYIHTPTAYPQSWGNWRINRPSVNTTLRTDTVVRHRRGLLPGYYMRWTTPDSGQQVFNGGWKSSNNASGLTNVETTMSFWDWGFRMNNAERIANLHNMTFNTSNTNYVDASTGWSDPDKGTTQIQIRYHADTNKIDLHDHTNNRVIATKDTDGDGNAIYLSHGMGTDTTDIADNFFGGGDVEIAASNFAPSFTTAPNMGYDADGILNATEMVKLDTAVPVGKRMIIYPEFWGLLEDMGGVASGGPAVDGTGWVDNDVVLMGWQKANSPHVGTNLGNSNSGWDAAMHMALRGAGTNHTGRISIYSPGNAAFTARDARVMSNNFTDLYFTFDRISTSSGRIMAFTTLAFARTGITGANNSWYASDGNYMNGNAQTLTLTSDNYLYIYSAVGNFTLPTVACTELLTIPS